MNTKFRRAFSWAWKTILGISILYLAYAILHSAFIRAGHRKAFSTVQHPAETTPVDSLSLRIQYYPATYIDPAFQYETVYFVGELRGYPGDWKPISEFYDRGSQPVHIQLLPVVFDRGQMTIDAGTGFKSESGYVLDPFTADLLENLERHYRLWGVPEGVENPVQKLYLVYRILWQADKP